jgi:hypothetical protein
MQHAPMSDSLGRACEGLHSDQNPWDWVRRA